RRAGTNEIRLCSAGKAAFLPRGSIDKILQLLYRFRVDSVVDGRVAVWGFSAAPLALAGVCISRIHLNSSQNVHRAVHSDYSIGTVHKENVLLLGSKLNLLDGRVGDAK